MKHSKRSAKPVAVDGPHLMDMYALLFDAFEGQTMGDILSALLVTAAGLGKAQGDKEALQRALARAWDSPASDELAQMFEMNSEP